MVPEGSMRSWTWFLLEASPEEPFAVQVSLLLFVPTCFAPSPIAIEAGGEIERDPLEGETSGDP